jgi:hypothetical protein
MDEPQADEEQEEAPLAESEQPATEEQPAMADGWLTSQVSAKM